MTTGVHQSNVEGGHLVKTLILSLGAASRDNMLATLRRCATISPDGKLRMKNKTLTLEHVRRHHPFQWPNILTDQQFLQRQKVVSLWRDCVRAINSKPT